MAGSTAGLDWPRASSVSPNSATTSSVFPDRPIRPLPKRRLRSRLSEEQAESIVYPPAPSSSSPLFGSPVSQADAGTNTRIYSDGHLPLSESHNLNRLPPVGGYQSDFESEDEHEENSVRRQPLGNAFIPPVKNRPSHSAASSGDGYESFENTNNKKKRKIPQNYPSGTHVDDLDGVAPTITAPHQLDGAGGLDVSAGVTSATGIGLSGAGRGRHGRMYKSKERQPFVSAPPIASLGTASATRHGPAQGVISSAISDNKAPAQHVRKDQKGLPRQQSPGPQPYPFSFERDSQSSNKLKEAPRPPMAAPTQAGATARDVSTRGTQTAAPAAGHDPRAQQNPPQAARPPAQGQAPPDQPPPPSKTQQYKMAAQERRRSQLGINARYLHERANVTLCEFCEFKAIWHYSPRFLIRRYEEKDLKRRQDIENRRRLLEKAKAKGRKTKKSGKGSKNANAHQAPQDPNQPPYDPAYDDDVGPQDAQSPGEEYFDDPDYDDPDADGQYADDAYDDYSPHGHGHGHGHAESSAIRHDHGNGPPAPARR